jgi:AcrR family transcriptional regulator
MLRMTASAQAVPTLPQQDRSRATRRRLLDSAVACLVRYGYAGTTTTRVCHGARVSQGALFKHFLSKELLLGETVQHLYARLVGDYEKALAGVAGSEDRIYAAVRLLWETFSSPAFHASLELIVASRTDPALRKALRPVLVRHAENLHRAACELFPAATSRSDLQTALNVILTTMQGAAASNIVRDDPDWQEQMLVYLERIARAALTEEAPRPTEPPSPQPARRATRRRGKPRRQSGGEP